MKYFLSLGLSTYAKDAEYLKEFVDYYAMIGIEKFYINVNNDEEQLVKQALGNYANVELDYAEIDNMIESNNHLAKRAENESEWLVIVDDDEFIVPYKDTMLPEFVKRVARDSVDEIVLASYNFGNSLLEKKTKDSVIDRFKFRSIHSTNTKSFIRPLKRLPTIDNVHCWNVVGDVVDEHGAVLDKEYKTKYEFCYDFTCNDCWINHYRIKSTEECKSRLTRKYELGLEPAFEKFMQENNENDVYDNRILKLIERIQRDNKN
jgi:hypothetical protein